MVRLLVSHPHPWDISSKAKGRDIVLRYREVEVPSQSGRRHLTDLSSIHIASVDSFAHLSVLEALRLCDGAEGTLGIMWQDVIKFS